MVCHHVPFTGWRLRPWGLGRWLAAVAVAYVLCMALPAQAQTLVLTEALAAADQGTQAFPDTAVARVVTLPDDWSVSRPKETSPLWYRLRFNVGVAREPLPILAVGLDRACGAVTIRLNGQLIHAEGPPMRVGLETAPARLDCQRPLRVALPRALLVPAGNTIDIQLAGLSLEQVASRQRAAGLSVVRIGPWDALAEPYDAAVLWRVTTPQITTTALALLGLVATLLGWRHRREGVLLYFGAFSLGWAVLAAHASWSGGWLPHYDRELLLVTQMPVITLFAVQFLLAYAHWRSRPIEVALIAQCVAVPVSLLLAGPMRLNGIASSWYVLLGLETAAAMGFFLVMARRQHRRDFWPALLPLSVLSGVVVYELVAQHHVLDMGLRVLPHVVAPVACVVLGLWLVYEHGRSLQTPEEVHQAQESRVREATAAMERNYAQMAELRVEQVTQQERKRIAADLHDDLGAKLLTIVHTSESDRISTLAREALEEMRLSVRGLTGKPVQLIDALGDWRAEVISRLQQTGVEGEWQAPSEDLPQTLSARAYVQTTRILREAVNNIIKHSGASRCSIRCSIEYGDFRLAIQDNGKGIPMELDGRLDRGHGMTSMKQRAKQLQGQCLVESGPGYGTVIRLTIPLDKHTLPAA